MRFEVCPLCLMDVRLYEYMDSSLDVHCSIVTGKMGTKRSFANGQIIVIPVHWKLWTQ